MPCSFINPSINQSIKLTHFRSAGKARITKFRQALQAATVEAGKPIEMRMDPEPEEAPSPQMVSPKRRAAAKERRKRIREEGVALELDLSRRSKTRGFEFLTVIEPSVPQPQAPTTTNLKAAIDSVMAESKNEKQTVTEQGGDELFCKVVKRLTVSEETVTTSLGFVKLKSRKECTFADARSVIQSELAPDLIPPETQWKFFFPLLGPVSNKQETSLGPLLPLLKKSTPDPDVANGSLLLPFEIYIVYSSS